MKTYRNLTRAEKEEITVTVCGSCNTSACVHGQFICDGWKIANIAQVPIYYLEQYGQEHSHYWEYDILNYFNERLRHEQARKET